jgi:RND superfamily putative drug exporter
MRASRRVFAGRPEPAMSLAALARFSYHRRRLVLVLWIVALVGLGFLASAAGGAYRNNFTLPNVESQRAFDLLRTKFPSQSGDTAEVVFKTDGNITDPAVQQRIEGVLAEVGKVPHVVGIASPYDDGGERNIAKAGDIAYATIQFDKRANDIPKSVGTKIIDIAAAQSHDGLQVEAGGQIIQNSEQGAPPASSGIAIIAAIVILLISFGSVIAMGLPIITALFGLGIGLSGLMIIATVLDVPEFAPEVAAMIGLGVGIDYALFIVTRYRQELHSGHTPEHAVHIALTTAGRAVLLAGATVVVSLLGMLLMGLSFLQGLALGASLTVLVTMMASITLLPAILGFAGRNIDKLKVPGMHRDESEHRQSVWFRWSRQVQRHPWAYTIVGFVIVVLLGIPALRIHLGNSDAGLDPQSFTTRHAYDLLSEGFGPGFNGPLVLAASTPNAGDAATLDELQQKLADTPGVAQASPPRFNDGGTAAVINVIPSTAPQDTKTQDLISHLRDDVIPSAVRGTDVHVDVGGAVAVGIDLSDYLAQRLPLFLGAVLILSFLLLMVVFRSLVVPLKAVIMNVLSIAAAYGVVVAIFQWGWGISILGVDKGGPIEAFVPMMLFAILFGLSMDYEVFLISRIREEYLKTGRNETAVADGLASTARVITAAAAIMIAVFLSFVLGDTRVIKLFGIGLASAIFIDATLVRMLLVPATMELLGDANWWLPKWLDRILPHVEVEGHVDESDEEPEEESQPVSV